MQHGSLPPASLVVCTRNRPGFVDAVVRSVLTGEHVPNEIVVVDQSDTPDVSLASMRPERACEVVYRPSASRGLSAARNEGIRVARNDVLVFVDDDVVATPTWLRTLLTTLVEQGVRAVVTGQVREGDPEVPGGFAPSLKTDAESAVYEGRVAADVLYPNNMAFYRSAVEEIGPFDERLGAGTKRFRGGEDNDVCFRLLEAGYRIVYEPRAVLNHRPWRPPGDFLRHRWDYGRGQGAFYGKHLRLDDSHMARRLARDVASVARRLLREAPRRPRVAAGHLMFLAGIVSAVVEWTASERILRGIRRSELD